MNFFHKMALHYMFTETTSSIITQKNHFVPTFAYFLALLRLNPINFPKPNKYANTDSYPFNSDESLSDEDSSQKPNIPPTISNYDIKTPSSNDSSPIKLQDNSSFKKIPKTHQTDIPSDRLQHPSQKQSILPPPPIDRSTKTPYNLRP